MQRTPRHVSVKQLAPNLWRVTFNKRVTRFCVRQDGERQFVAIGLEEDAYQGELFPNEFCCQQAAVLWIDKELLAKGKV